MVSPHVTAKPRPMLSVKDITRAQVDALIERVDGARGPIAVAVTNSATHYVLSGYPEDLAAFGVEVGQGTQASGQAARREGAWRPRVRTRRSNTLT
ncbi:MAG: hypothetical protein V9G11_03910 [Bifidobacterium adolescentis]